MSRMFRCWNVQNYDGSVEEHVIEGVTRRNPEIYSWWQQREGEGGEPLMAVWSHELEDGHIWGGGISNEEQHLPYFQAWWHEGDGRETARRTWGETSLQKSARGLLNQGAKGSSVNKLSIWGILLMMDYKLQRANHRDGFGSEGRCEKWNWILKWMGNWWWELGCWEGLALPVLAVVSNSESKWS